MPLLINTPHEQIVWMLKGKMDFRIGNDRRSMVAGDVAVQYPVTLSTKESFQQDTEVVDIFAPPREDFLTSDVPPYMRILRTKRRFAASQSYVRSRG